MKRAAPRIARPLARSLAGYSPAAAGPLSSLDLDHLQDKYSSRDYDMFTNKNFSDLVTFTRASAKWVPDATGALVQVASGLPGTAYDQLTLDKQGFSIEEQRTNLLLNSDGTFMQLDSRGGVSDAATPIASFFGKSIQFPAGGGQAYAYKNFTSTTGVQYCLSIYVKMDDGQMPLVSTSSTTGDFSLVSDGGLWSTPAPVVTSLGGGVYRVSTVYLVPAGRSGSWGVVRYAAQSQSGFRVTGFQLEQGTFPTSYIPTTSAQVTRSADSAIISNVAPWLNPTEGTVYAELIVPSNVVTANGIVALHDGTINNRMVAYFLSGTVRVLSTVGGSGQSFSLGAIPGAGAVLKVAFAYKANDFAGSMNGAAAVPYALAGVPAVNALRLGGTNNGAAEALNAQIRTIRYFPRRLSNAELQALTVKADPGFTLDFNFDAKTYYMGLS